MNDSKWNTLIGFFVDNLVAHDDTQRRARTMENTESAFLVSSEVSGSKTFCLAFFKTEFINLSAWARGKGWGVGCRKS